MSDRRYILPDGTLVFISRCKYCKHCQLKGYGFNGRGRCTKLNKDVYMDGIDSDCPLPLRYSGRTDEEKAIKPDYNPVSRNLEYRRYVVMLALSSGK